MTLSHISEVLPRVLTEQPYVLDDKESVGKVAAAAGMKILGFHRWQLGGS